MDDEKGTHFMKVQFFCTNELNIHVPRNLIRSKKFGEAGSEPRSMPFTYALNIQQLMYLNAINTEPFVCVCQPL